MIDQRREQRFLEDINRYLPKNVDWKQGAIDYLQALMEKEGGHNELYHLIKPFLGGPDFGAFYSEMYGFLNMASCIELPMKSRVLDVACGPGWTSHFLAKLGYDALGIDISADLIALARKRVAREPFGPYERTPLTARFEVHDIEDAPLATDVRFDAAFFESAMHHFYNPIAAIRNISRNLSDDGLLCIWEAAAPIPGSDTFKSNTEIMKTYRTLERPYTRDQLIELLSICGFEHQEFFSQVNGLFNPNLASDRASLEQQAVSARDWNICVAARTDTFFARKGRTDSPAPMPESVAAARLTDGLLGVLRIKQQEDFVAALYRSILQREPDAQGLAHYVAKPDNIFSRLRMITTFLTSAERKARSGSRR